MNVNTRKNTELVRAREKTLERVRQTLRERPREIKKHDKEYGNRSGYEKEHE